jgi:selenocysteine-specific elongation factor
MHVIGTAGHVDHGKSALVQRLTGMDPDRFEEEKRRGLTIDLGFAWVTLPSGIEVGIVDVPGHERFIKNMLAGAGGVTVCILVVAANEGWMPQSSEHLAVLDVLGVSSGVVALTKIDLVDGEKVAVTAAEISDRLRDTTLEGIRVVPCSSETGEGTNELLTELDRVVADATPPPDFRRPRLWVDRVFTMAGAGTVVTGTLAGGSLVKGEPVEISPEGRPARVRSIQSHKKEIERIGPGNRVALNLAGLDREGARRGDAVVGAGRWRPTRMVDAHVRVLPAEVTGREHRLTEKGSHLLYAGSAETPVRIALVGASRLEPGEEGFARLYLRDPLPLARDDRFVLRDAGRVLTFGGGRILDPLPERRGDTTKRFELLRRLVTQEPADALAALLEHEGSLHTADALLRSGAISATVGVELGNLLVSKQRFADLGSALMGALKKWHHEHPLDAGMPKERLRATTDLGPREFDDLVALLPPVGVESALVRLQDFAVRLDEQQDDARRRLINELEAAGFSPPLASELEVDDELLRSLAAAGEVVRIGSFYLAKDTAQRARALVRDAIASNGPITVAQIRDLLQTTRKYAVPLCEWLDETGATIRRGDVRTAGPRD